MGSRNKFSLVAQAATLGNFFNLHKCKTAADRYRRFLILKPLVPTSSVILRLRVVWFVDSRINCYSTSHIQQFYKLHPTNTTFTLSGMTTVELSSIYSHSSSRLLLSACSSSPSATTTTSSSLSTISSPASAILALSSSTACITPCVVWGLQQPSCPRQLQ